MELAGIAVAQVTHQIAGELGHSKKIAVLVGPGNNGGDGLVAARHLKMMRYDVGLFLFKKPSDKKNGNFLTLCEHNDIPYKYVDETCGKESAPLELFTAELKRYDLVIDAIFGFPFQG